MGNSRVADIGYRSRPERRIADIDYSGINQPETLYFCGPCR
ncbi:hypothetical protein ACIPL1_30040 [Pseudomonas sp. NPDC090202]